MGNPTLEGLLARMTLNSLLLKEIGKKEVELPKVFVEGYTKIAISLVKNFVYCKTEKTSNDVLKEGCFKIRDGKIEPVEGIFYIPVTKINPIGFRQRAFYNYYIAEDLIYNELEKVEKRVEKITNKERWLIKVKDDDIKVYVNAKKGKVMKYDLIGQQGKLHVIRVPPITFKPMSYEIIKSVSIYNHRVDFEYEVVKFQLSSFGGLAEIVLPLYSVTKATVNSPEHEELTFTLYSSYLYLFAYPSN
jgi:hypothetical protein